MKQEVRVSRLRTERDDKATANYKKLVAARQGFDGLQGDKGGFETAFVSGTAPRNPKRLLEQMEQSVTLLNDPAVEPRDHKVAGFDVDYAAVAGDLETGMRDLRGTVDLYDEEKKREEGTMLARRQAIDELKSTVIWAGRSAEGLFSRAGEDELAKRIRTSTRRPLRPSEEKTDSEEPAADEQPASEEQAVEEQASASDSAAEDSASGPVSGSTEPDGQPAQSSDS